MVDLWWNELGFGRSAIERWMKPCCCSCEAHLQRMLQWMVCCSGSILDSYHSFSIVPTSSRVSIPLMYISGESSSVVSKWRDGEITNFLSWPIVTASMTCSVQTRALYSTRWGRERQFYSNPMHATTGSGQRSISAYYFGSNIPGTEKQCLLVIVKSKQPCCFSHWRHIPTTYKGNQDASMTASIFNSWLLRFSQKVKARNWFVFLFLDIASCHSKIPVLKAIEVIFFPAKHHFLPSTNRPRNCALCQVVVQNKVVRMSAVQYAARMLLNSWHELCCSGGFGCQEQVEKWSCENIFQKNRL